MAYKQKGFPMHRTASALKQGKYPLTKEEDKFVKEVAAHDKEREIEDSYHSGGGFSIPYKDPLDNPQAIKEQQERVEEARANPDKYKEVIENEDGTYTETHKGKSREIDQAGRVMSSSSDREKVSYNSDGTIKSREIFINGRWVDVTQQGE